MDEDAGSVTVRISRAGSGMGACTLGYVVDAGSATAGTDYTDESGTFAWADGETGERTEAVTILDRSGQQANRTFAVVASAAECSDTLSTATATVTIRDTDGATSDTPAYSDPISGVTLLGGRRLVSAATSDELANAIEAASCGDDITLAEGTYTIAATLATLCPANNPVRILGAASFGSVYSAQLSFEYPGSYAIVTGVDFDGGRIICRGKNNKIIGNRFRGSASGSQIQLEAHDSPLEDEACEIAYNDVIGPGPGCSGAAEFRQWIKMNTGGSGLAQTVQRNVWIHHNQVRWPTSNCDQGDVIELGESGIYDYTHTMRSGTYLEDNLFENVISGDSGAVMDLKIGGNFVLRNTVRGANGERLSQRVGQETIFEANYLADGSDIVVSNALNTVACNTVTSGDIRNLAGDQDVGEFGNGHTRADDTLFVSNHGTLNIGYQWNDTYTLPATDTVVEDHTGTIHCILESATVGACGDSATPVASRMCTAAVELSESQVGSDALGNAPTEWATPRGL
ncbi:MAG: hypothetical protein JRI23_10035 [Deltaproteobacteria bacterium]|nr:hypothetical protein [Deltaproteobacteria bacterium]MBW2532011.1 hypothetical protein [Deltaproteobacteria bacterium]